MWTAFRWVGGLETLWFFVPTKAKALILASVSSVIGLIEGLPLQVVFLIAVMTFGFGLWLVLIVNSAIDEAVSKRRRGKSQPIADLLLRYHKRGTKLLNKGIQNDVERAAWKDEYRAFMRDLVREMTATDCSASEIYQIKQASPTIPLTSYPKTYPKAVNLKAHLMAQLDQIGVVADRHDTTKPVD